MKQQIENLRTKIKECNHQYYVLGTPTVPDAVYDRMFKKLRDLEGQYPEYYDLLSPTCRVGSDLVNSFPTHTHLSPMLSIDALQEIWELDVFLQKGEALCQIKYDGVGVNLIYRAGKLAMALTRGDGYKGMDVTANVLTIPGIPLGVNCMDELEVRGEVWCPYSELKRLQQQGENVHSPLAVAINSIRTKYSDRCAQRRLRFTAYHVTYGVAGSTHTENLEWLRSNHFDTAAILDHRLSPGQLERRVKTQYADIPSDGVVYKHNDMELCTNVGHTPRSVRWAVAWKFDRQLYNVEVVHTSGRVGNGGLVNFFAYFTPLVINSEKICKVQVPPEADIHPGDMITIRRKGTRVAILENYTGALRPTDSLSCTCCGARLRRRGSLLLCPDNCQMGVTPTVIASYDQSMETTPDGFSIDAGLMQAIAHEAGCALVPQGRNTSKYTLYFDTPQDLATIGYRVGQYVHSLIPRV